MKTQRHFDFPRDIYYLDALRVVRAALDDEGLVLSSANTTHDRCRSVLTQDALRVIVPLSRIHSRDWPRG